jgi:hypothetical protein
MPSLTRTFAHLPLGLIAGLVLPSCGGDSDPYGPPPADLEVAGSYDAVSRFDLTAGAVLPSPVGEYAQVLTGLRTNPAGTFFTLLDAAGVPLASDLVGALPSVLQGRLEGWINEALAATPYGDGPATAELDRLIAATEAVLTRFDVASRLTIGAVAPAGQGEATHALNELRYALYDGAVGVTVPIVLPPGVPANLLVRETPTSVQVTSPRGVADARLVVGSHSFGLPYGAYAWEAIGHAARARYGVDGLRGALGTLVDCSGMAANVAGRCVLGVCVGHEADLRAICETGLDLAADQLREEITELRFDALTLASGEADLWDASTVNGNVDGRVSRIEEGVWKATIDVGMGPRPAPAEFAGVRLP